jgi:hypothetical protein
MTKLLQTLAMLLALPFILAIGFTKLLLAVMLAVGLQIIDIWTD